MREDFDSEILKAQADVIKDVGIFGLKTLVVLNSGASLAILAFIGNAHNNQSEAAVINITEVRCAMVLFLLGITAALISGLFAYILAQIGIRNHSNVERISFAGFLSMLIIPAFISFLLFIIGFLMVVFSFA